MPFFGKNHPLRTGCRSRGAAGTCDYERQHELVPSVHLFSGSMSEMGVYAKRVEAMLPNLEKPRLLTVLSRIQQPEWDCND
jgi:hypothetical protein